MTGEDVIEEIKRLPEIEARKVIEFTRAHLEPHELSGKEIANLTQKMIDAGSPEEAARLEEEIVRGFYGGKPHA
jgi:hypothetical protein